MDNIQFQKLSPSGMEFRNKVLSALYRGAVPECLMDQGFRGEIIKTAMWRYACFLTLTSMYPWALVPSQLIDAVHHAFITDPITYEQCMIQLNHSIEHVPYMEGQYFDRAGFLQRFAYTKLLFRKTFEFEMVEDDRRDADKVGGCHLIKKINYFELSHIEDKRGFKV